MKFFASLFFALSFLTVISCIRYEDPNDQLKSNWQGEYYGTFSGDQSGTISFTVSKTGNIEGLIRRKGYADDELDGHVTNGINGNFSFNSKDYSFFFSGFLNRVISFTGTWYNPKGGRGDYVIKIKQIL